MDDLLGEDWQAPAKKPVTSPLKPAPVFPAPNHLQPHPSLLQPRTSSPANLSRSANPTQSNKSSTNDQFGSLLSLKSQKPTNQTLSLQQRQEQLSQEKRKQQEQNSELWNHLGSGRATPDVKSSRPPPSISQDDEDDILAAFNKAAPVDSTSLFPPPPQDIERSEIPSNPHNEAVQGNGFANIEDDDPFGLGALPRQVNGHAASSQATSSTPPMRRTGHDNIEDDDEDDNLLGDLGKPVVQRPTPKATAPPQRDVSPLPSQSRQDEPLDQALAELVDMGFPLDTSKVALGQSGGNVQAAVGLLLQQAHEESRQKARAEAQSRQTSPPATSRSPQRRGRADQEAIPAWMKQESRPSSAIRKQNNASPSNSDRDASQVAQELGSKFLKSANSLWKASQKQMAKTISEFQHERDPSQPKWMPNVVSERESSSSRARMSEARVNRSNMARDENITDEAAMLDAPRTTRPSKVVKPTAMEDLSEPVPRNQSPADSISYRSSPQPRPVPLPQAPDRRPITKITRQDVEDQSAQAYVSPARRKRPTPQSENPVKTDQRPEPEVDLFSSAPPQPRNHPTANAVPLQQKPMQTVRPVPASVPRNTPSRSIPSVSAEALATSEKHRKAGGTAFKRGDFAAAHESYTAALTPLPPTHPTIVIVLTNRALTALKTGDAKTAVSDANRALEIIGPNQGLDESIHLGTSEGSKDMREFYGKALTRKAEALEQMEKWVDAATVWRQAITTGVGGATSLQGRDRCEKAAAPKPTTSTSTVSSQPKRTTPGNPSIRKAPTPTSSSSNAAAAAAVQKLRATHAAAEKADDEKFALADQVDARLAAWKAGKADNLRALLQSLDVILGPEAGWKKVGMADLVVATRVKIVYMKAIAKVHPDKIAQNASTEQRMLSASVFAILNEAWDKFKKDNNL